MQPDEDWACFCLFEVGKHIATLRSIRGSQSGSPNQSLLENLLKLSMFERASGTERVVADDFALRGVSAEYFARMRSSSHLPLVVRQMVQIGVDGFRLFGTAVDAPTLKLAYSLILTEEMDALARSTGDDFLAILNGISPAILEKSFPIDPVLRRDILNEPRRYFSRFWIEILRTHQQGDRPQGMARFLTKLGGSATLQVLEDALATQRDIEGRDA
jgi:hypothetical protein